MAEEFKYSPLLKAIMTRAESIIRENQCAGLTRDLIIVAALLSLDDLSKTIETRNTDEYKETFKLLVPFTRDKAILNKAVRQWQNREIPRVERMMLAMLKNQAVNETRSRHLTEITADIYLGEILRKEPDSLKALHKQSESASRRTETGSQVREDALKQLESAINAVAKQKDTQEQTAAAESPDPASNSISLAGIVNSAKQLQKKLLSTVMGQDQAVSVFVRGFFQSELQAAVHKDRKQPRGTFLFAGPPGVGKTFLSEVAADMLQLPFRRFDMSEYANPNAVDELSGSDEVYKGTSEGQLTGFVNKNPHCLLLFDEIEKASIDIIHLFLQVLDAGRLRDNKTDKEVSFKDAILIFTTNAGKSLYEDNEETNLSSLSRDVILSALKNEINPKTRAPFFPAAICSRFAAGNVVMFNRLDAHSLLKIVKKQLNAHIDDLSAAARIAVEMDEAVPLSILLSEGASADARTVKSSANTFFSGELYELFRLMTAKKTNAPLDRLNKIRISVNKSQMSPAIRKLYDPSKAVHALIYSDDEFARKQTISKVVLHTVHSFEEAKAVIDTQDIQLILCDMFWQSPEKKQLYMNAEDQDIPGRTFLYTMLERYPGIPLIMLETENYSFSDEEKESFLRRGVRSFIKVKDTDSDTPGIQEYLMSIFQQNSLSALARANRLIRFETAQKLSRDEQTAEIILFDFKLEKAIKAEDTNNVLSLLSTPDQRFDDVIGAEDAKAELKYFVSYMKDPRTYRAIGASAPKGILLYGPPGTGKTMLAKAFAAESKATFIATEGNRFQTRYAGDGSAMIHRLFKAARRYAPSVLFIDEIDTIARTRTGRDSDIAQDTEQTLTALFAEMDGFSTDPSKPVFVLGATNYRPEPGSMSLDPGFLRRFDRRILIDLPGMENRKVFLKTQTTKKPVFQVTEQAIDSLAERSSGMSLAQLSSVLDLSIRKAMQNKSQAVNDEILEEAFEQFNSGERKQWSPNIVLRTARHEAGHTLISWLSGDKPSYVTVVSRGQYGGYMQHGQQEDRMGYTREELLNHIRAALGGRAAEIVYYGPENGLSTGASGDLKNATELARQMLCDYGMNEDFGMAAVNPNDSISLERVRAHVNCILQEQLKAAVDMIETHRPQIDALVEQLRLRDHLSGDAIDRILKGVKA